MIELERLGKWQPPAVDVTEKELETASAAWQAYRAPTPEACFDLLGKDLSALPLLKPVLIDLLEELPSSSTGLGATEMRMLELIARGYSRDGGRSVWAVADIVAPFRVGPLSFGNRPMDQ